MKKKIIIALLICLIIMGVISTTFAASVNDQVVSNSQESLDIGEQLWEFGAKVFKISYLFFLLLWLYFILFGIKKIQSLHHGGFVKKKDIIYCREIPKSVNLELAYASLYYCSHISRRVLKKGILTAFILQWANEDNILITNKGNNIYSIDLKDGNFFKKDIEQELYNLLKSAAGDNNTIDNNELKTWSQTHQKELKDWYNHLLKRTKGVNLKQIATYLLGLRKYLLDYSLIDERRHIEVKLWEEYLIYSTILGIADKVSAEFKKVYPDYNKIGIGYYFDSMGVAFNTMMLYLFLLVPLSLSFPCSIIIAAMYYFIKF